MHANRSHIHVHVDWIQVPDTRAPPTSSTPSGSHTSVPADTGTSACVNSELFESTSCDSLGPTLVQLSPAPQQPSADSDRKGRQQGVALLELSAIQVFFVSSFRGDPTHDCMCAWVSEGEGSQLALSDDNCIIDSGLGSLSPWQSRRS